MSIEKIDKKIEEIASYLKHLDEIETNEYLDEMLEENEYEEKLAKGLVYLEKTENTGHRIGENKKLKFIKNPPTLSELKNGRRKR